MADDWLDRALRGEDISGTSGAVGYRPPAQTPGITPQAAAEAQRRAAAIGEPVTFDDYMADAQARAEAEKKRKDALMGAPRTQTWLAEPANAAVAQGAEQEVSWFERLATQVGDAIGSWGSEDFAAIGRAGEIVRDVVADPGKAAAFIAEDARAVPGATVGGVDDLVFYKLAAKVAKGWASPAELAQYQADKKRRDAAPVSTPGPMSMVARQLPQMVDTTVRAVPAGVTGAAIFAGGAAATGAGLPAAPGAALVGLGVGIKAGTVPLSFDQSLGSVYAELDGFEDQNGKPLPQDVIRVASILAAVPITGLEAFGLGKLLENVGGDVLTVAGIKRALAKPSVVAAFAEIGARYRSGVTVETATEMFQQALQIVAGEAVIAGVEAAEPGRDFPQRTPVEAAQEILKAGAVGGLVAGTIQAPGSALRLNSELARVKAARQQAALFDAIGEQAANSELKGRLPEAYQKAVDAAVAGGPVETVYIDPGPLVQYLQSQGSTDAELAQELGIPQEDVTRALAQGTLLGVPTGTYAAKIAGTPLDAAMRPHMALRADGVTAAQAKEIEANLPEMTETVKADREAAEAEATARAEEEAPLREALKAELSKDRGFGPRDVDAITEATVAGYRQLAAAKGVSLAEVMEEYTPYEMSTVFAGPPRPRPAAAPQTRGGPAPATIAPIIANTAQTYGVDEGYLTNLARKESGFRPAITAATSSAAGLYQFIDSTWISTVKNGGLAGFPGAAEIAGSITFNRGRAVIVNDDQRRLMAARLDPSMAGEAVARLTKANAKALQAALKRAPTNAELYLAHFAGAGGATTLLKAAPDALAAELPGMKAAANANPTIYFTGRGKDRKARTVAEVIARLSAGFEGEGAAGAPGAPSAPQAPIPTFDTDPAGAILNVLTDDGPLPLDGDTYEQFAGRRALTSNTTSLKTAQLLTKREVDPETIWKQTGWRRGEDRMWRFEIDDSEARLVSSAPALLTDDAYRRAAAEQGGPTTKPLRLSDIYDHPKLYAAYPDLADVVVDTDVPDGAWGAFSPSEGKVSLDVDRSSAELLKTLTHEIQHAIQEVEGFAKGASADEQALRSQGYGAALDRNYDTAIRAKGTQALDPKEIRDAILATYHRASGEVEARLTEARMAMDAQERADTFPVGDVPFGEGYVAGEGQPSRMPVADMSVEEFRLAQAKAGNQATIGLAQAYREAFGITTPRPTAAATPREDVMKRMADAFEAMPLFDDSPETMASYAAMKRELLQQAEYLGDLIVERWGGKGEPYPNSVAMMVDVMFNGHFYFSPTDAAYGAGEGTTASNDPLLEDSGLRDVDDNPLLFNDVFRIVHDIFGHTMGGENFGPVGELNAYLEHASMFSPQARPAVAAQTLMQNAWVNFGKHLRRADGSLPQKGDSDYVPLSERRFSDQKIALAPDYVMRYADALRDEAEREAGVAQRAAALLESYRSFVESQGIAGRPDRIEPVAGGDGLLTLSHWGKRKGLRSLDPAKWGVNFTFLPREERNRIGEAPDRTYYGLHVGTEFGYQQEDGLGPHEYSAHIDPAKLYDFDADPDGLLVRADAMIEAGDLDSRSSAYELAIKAAGFSGYWTNNPEIGMVAAVFERLPAIYEGRSMTFYQGGLFAGGSSEPILFSALERAVRDSQTRRASAEQWIATLSKTPGVKREELEWSTVLEWLNGQEGPVDREALLAYVEGHGVSVEEVILGEDASAAEINALAAELERKWEDDYFEQGYFDGQYYVTQEEVETGDYDENDEPIMVERWVVRDQYDDSSAIDLSDTFDDENAAQESAAELNSEAERYAMEDSKRDTNFRREAEKELEDKREPKWETYSMGGAEETYREFLFRLPGIPGGDDNHWPDTPNVFAHARTKIRPDADNRHGPKTLELNEVQGTWPQAGRDLGFRGAGSALEIAEAQLAEERASQELTATQRAMIEYAKGFPDEVAVEMGNYVGSGSDLAYEALPFHTALEIARHIANRDPKGRPEGRALIDAAGDARLRLVEASERRQRARSGVADMPFKTTWPMLVMKRMIRYAVDNNLGKIVWITGEQQNGGRTVGTAGRTTIRATGDGDYQVTPEENYRSMIDKLVNMRRGPIKKRDDRRTNAEILGPKDEMMSAQEVRAIFNTWRDNLGDRMVEAADANADDQLEFDASAVGLEDDGHGFYDRMLVSMTNDLIKKYGGRVERMRIARSSLGELRMAEDALDAARAIPDEPLTTAEKMRLTSLFEELDALLDRNRRSETPDYEAQRELGRQIAPLDERNRRDGIIAERERLLAEQVGEQPGFTITPELAAAARGGFTLFQRKADVEPSSEEVNAKAQELAKTIPGLKRVLRHLKPDEKAKLRKDTAAKMMKIISDLPSAEEMASVAYSGRAKRGWYKDSANALLEVFGLEDAPRFAALLAAMSPQTSVEDNLTNALRVWTAWDKAGRPTDKDQLVELMGKNVLGTGTVDSVLGSWINNSVTALTMENPAEIQLSGPKVNSFMLNLVGVVDELTNDAWMANYALVDQAMFAKTGPTPGKGPGYIAMNALTRKAAEIISKRLGVTWTPAEVQETVWSWARTLYVTRDRAGGDATTRDILAAGGLTHEDIGATPDFALLFLNGIYSTILREGGYGDKLENLGSRGRAARAAGEVGDATVPEGSGVPDATFRRHLDRAAERLEQLRTQRAQEAERKRVEAAALKADGPTLKQGRDTGPTTPAFRAWFKDSKVVDAGGKPLVVYHGTGYDFDVFEGRETTGWFSEDRGLAQEYADRSVNDEVEDGFPTPTPRVQEVYLSVQNPKIVEGLDMNEDSTWGEVLTALGLDPESGWAPAKQTESVFTVVNNDETVGALAAQGYDGIRVTEGGKQTWLAFKPTQIKSAVSNSGAYSPTDPSILAQKSDDPIPRGAINFDPRGVGKGKRRPLMQMFAGRNLSTPLHETAHFFLEIYRNEMRKPSPPARIAADMKVLLEWWNIPDESLITAREHEMFAEAFEQYLYEGRAPSVGLRGVFERFRSWLVFLYRATGGRTSNISDEVRAVFDRMLASDAEIAQARALQGMLPMLNDPAAQGLSEAQAKVYAEAQQQAVAAAQGEADRRLLSALSRQQKAWWRDAADTMSEKVDREVAERPVYRAFEWLTHETWLYGEPPQDLVRGKLSKADIERDYGADKIKALPRGFGRVYAAEGGQHPDAVAEAFGFGSGGELLDALAGMERRSEVVKRETQERMEAEYGGPGMADIPEVALDAIHNRSQQRVIELELEALRGRPAQRGMAEAARLDARDRLVGDLLKPDKHLAAERKAANAAQRAFQKGDLLEAGVQKLRQLTAFVTWRATRDAADEIETDLRYLKKFDKPGVRKKLAGDYIEQIDALLGEYDLRQASGTELSRRESLAVFAARMEAEGLPTNIDPRLLERAQRRHYSKLSLDELRGLVDTVKSIDKLGRLKKELLDNKARRDREEIIDEMLGQTFDMKKVFDIYDLTQRGKTRLLRGIDAALSKMEFLTDELDRHLGVKGVFYRLLIAPAATAQITEGDIQADIGRSLRSLYQAIPAETRKRWDAHVTFPELTTKYPIKMSRGQLVAIALNMGSVSSREKLLGGYGWAEPDVLEILKRELTEQEWAFVQGVWDTLETLWPMIEKVEKTLTGSVPERVVAAEIVTPYGTLRGGYYPVKYDTMLDGKVAKMEAGEANDMFGGFLKSAATPSGHTKNRTGYIGPVRLSVEGVLFGHVNKVIKRIAYGEFVVSAQQFLTDERVSQTIREKLGPEYYDMMIPWLRRQVNDQIAPDAVLEPMDAAIRYARTASTYMGMGFRLSTAVAQLAGLLTSMHEVGAVEVSAAVAETALNPAAARDFVLARSGEVRQRGDNLDRDMRELMKQMTGKDGIDDKVRGAAFFHIGFVDRYVVAIPTWLAAYRKALKAGDDEETAIALGDKAVRLSQGAGGVKDLSHWQSGGEGFKLLSMFYSYFNTMYNQQRKAVRSAGRGEFGPALSIVFYWMIAAPIASALLAGDWPDEDLDEWETWAAWAGRKVLFGAFASVPVLRDIASVAGRKVEGKFSEYTVTPAARFYDVGENQVEDIVDLVTGEDVSDRWLKHVIETTGYFLQLPLGQVASTAQYAHDWMTGKQTPEDIGDVYKGLTKGPQKDQE